MRIKYARFLQGIGSPGYAGNNIQKAFLRSKSTQAMVKDVVMDDMFIEGRFLVLRREMDNGAIAERLVPIVHCIDLEPAPPEPEPKKKKDKPNEPADQS